MGVARTLRRLSDEPVVALEHRVQGLEWLGLLSSAWSGLKQVPGSAMFQPMTK